jgi:hypothetical protein
LIDLKRGAIPLENRQVVKSSGTVYLERYDDIRQVEGAGWLPFRKLVLLSGGSTRILQVQHANFRNPPPASVFQLEFDEPQAIVDTVRYVKHEPRTTFGLAQLSSPAPATIVPLPRADTSPSVPPPSMPPPRDAPWWGMWGSMALIVVGLVLLIATGIAIYRRLRHA